MGLLCASSLLHDVLLQDAVVLVQLHLWWCVLLCPVLLFLSQSCAWAVLNYLWCNFLRRALWPCLCCKLLLCLWQCCAFLDPECCLSCSLFGASAIWYLFVAPSLDLILLKSSSCFAGTGHCVVDGVKSDS